MMERASSTGNFLSVKSGAALARIVGDLELERRSSRDGAGEVDVPEEHLTRCDVVWSEMLALTGTDDLARGVNRRSRHVEIRDVAAGAIPDHDGYRCAPVVDDSRCGDEKRDLSRHQRRKSWMGCSGHQAADHRCLLGSRCRRTWRCSGVGPCTSRSHLIDTNFSRSGYDRPFGTESALMDCDVGTIQRCIA